MSDIRYENKFVTKELTRPQIELLIRLHPLAFSEIYHERYINNIYFDTHDSECYRDSIEGHPYRQKIRVRWYGQLWGDISKPVLELKIKKNSLTVKKQYDLKPFSFLKDDKMADILKETILESEIGLTTKNLMELLMPVLVNRYKRKYYQSFDRQFRLTVDSELITARIFKLSQQMFHWAKCYDTVIELKYARHHDISAANVMNFFPFRVTKNSKYTIGFQELGMPDHGLRPPLSPPLSPPFPQPISPLRNHANKEGSLPT